MKMLLTKKFSFEMAHALGGYQGKCAHLHGHSYHLEVTVEASNLGPDGMGVDFHSLKQLVQETVVDRFDHALVLSADSTLLPDIALENLVRLPVNPTTENLLLHFANLLRPRMPEGVRLHSLRLAETESSIAELVL